MPEETYMVIDPRRDHSIRVPRPDLSKTLGTPNACNGCHNDRSVDWSVEAVEMWYGEDGRDEPHWGEAIHAGRLALEGAEDKLARLIEDPQVPAIARATALTLFPRYAMPASLPVIRDALGDPDPLVRGAAAGATEAVEPMTRLRWVYAALSDSVRSVRHDAARVLASVPPALLSPAQRESLNESLNEVIAAALRDGDRADGRLRLGAIRFARGELFEAEREYKRAIEISPSFVPTYVNLADLYREMGADSRSEQVLRDGLARIPGDAGLHHALGLALVRLDRHGEAIDEFARAVELDPDRQHYRYVHAVAVHSMGDREGALRLAREASARHPGDPELRHLLLQLQAGR
jgi:tetratricopeptide (TPR) repeat protein